MANSEVPKAINFIEVGLKPIASFDPKIYTPEELGAIVDKARESTLIGKPVRIHTVFLEGANILSETDLGKKMTEDELKHAKKIWIQIMSSSQRVFMLKPNPQGINTDSLIEPNLDMDEY